MGSVYHSLRIFLYLKCIYLITCHHKLDRFHQSSRYTCIRAPYSYQQHYNRVWGREQFTYMCDAMYDHSVITLWYDLPQASLSCHQDVSPPQKLTDQMETGRVGSRVYICQPLRRRSPSVYCNRDPPPPPVRSVLSVRCF